MTIQSSQEINEVFTFFLILEEGQGFQVKIIEKLEKMISAITSEFNSILIERFSIGVFNVNTDWIQLAESLFEIMDEENIGHIDAESIQFLVLTLVLPDSRNCDPIIIRKNTFQMLKDMNHTNGLVTLRC